MKILILSLIISTFSLKTMSQDMSSKNNLFSMSIEELLQQKVSTIASNLSTTEDKAPSVVKVITREEIDAMGATSLNEVLESVNGIHLDRGNTNVTALQINIRGIYTNQNQQVLVLIDGKRRKDNIQSSAFFYRRKYVPVHNIKRIEIIKGPGSALYGADALAGVINIITQGPNDYSGFETGYIGGSYNTSGGYVKYANSKSQLKYSLSTYYLDSSINNEELKKDAQSTLDSLLGTNASQAPAKMLGTWRDTIIESKLAYKNFEAELMYSRSIAIQEFGLGNVLIENQTPFESIEGRVRFKYHNNFSKNTTYEISTTRDNFQQLTYKNKIAQLFPGGTNLSGPGGTFGPEGMLASPEFGENDDSVDIKILSNNIKKHSISVGAGFLHADLYEIKEKKNFDGSLKPIGRTIETTDTADAYMPEISRTSYYFYGQDEWQLHRNLKLVVGTRWDHFNDIGSSTNPRTSLIYAVNEKVTSRFMYGKAFRAPNLLELHGQNNPVVIGNKKLKPEHIEYYEFANSFQPNNNLKFNLNLFKYQFTDVIDLDETKFYSNIGRYYGEGLEFEMLAQIKDNLRLELNHAITNVKDQNDEVAPKLIHNQSFIGLNYQLYKNWSINAQEVILSKMARSTSDPRPDKDGVAYMNLTINSPKFFNYYNFSLQVKNLFDENLTYSSKGVAAASAENQASDSSAGRRSLYLTLRGKF